MKRILCACLGLAASIAGITASGQGSLAPRITLVSPRITVSTQSFWATVARGVQSAGLAFRVSTLVTGSRYVIDPELVVDGIDSAVASRVDGIITSYVAHPQWEDAVRRAAAAGIPVVLVDVDDPGVPRLAFAGIDNYGAGRAMAEAAIAETGGRGAVAVLSGAVPQTATQLERIRGFRDAIRSSPALRLVATLNSETDLLTQSSALLAFLDKHKEVSVLACVDGGCSASAALVMKQLGLQGRVALITFDLRTDIREYIESGVVLKAFSQDGFKAGYEAVRAIMAFRRGSPSLPKVIDVPVSQVGRESLDSLSRVLGAASNSP